MPSFPSYDGTALSFRLKGDGVAVVCLPGGPMQDSRYLGDLGGLSSHVQLIMLDPRGTGQSAIPDDLATYRCDRQVDDVEALRVHLGLEQMVVLGHSAGANLAVLYAARYPERVSALLLVTPGTAAVGIEAAADTRRQVALQRSDEPWFPEAFAALEKIMAGAAPDETARTAIDAFWYGRWDDAAQAHHKSQAEHRNDDAATVFRSAGAFNPEATRASLSTFEPPVLLLAGEVDLNTPPGAVTEYAALFGRADLVVQPGASHYPWIDDPGLFVSSVTTFVNSSR